MPCFEVNACPNVDRLCHAAHAISKVDAGSCMHWSLHHQGVMTLSRDGVLKMKRNTYKKEGRGRVRGLLPDR